MVARAGAKKRAMIRARTNRVRPFSKFLKHNTVLVDLSELSTRISSFLNWTTFKFAFASRQFKENIFHNSHAIVTKTMYFMYNCNKRKSPGGKDKRCPISKNDILQQTEIYQHRVVPQKF